MNFTNNVTNQVRSIADVVATTVKQMMYNAGQPGSTPNKVISVLLSSAAAYAVGVEFVYVAFATVYTILFVLPTPRWVVETSMASLLLLSAAALPQDRTISLAMLLLSKLILETWFCFWDKFIQFYAAKTVDQKHSYYYMFLGTVSVLFLSVTHASSYFQGFFEGLVQGLAGN